VVGETLHQRNNVLLLPTVTSFIQAVHPGEPFRISVHAWENPEPSRHAYNIAKDPDLVIFEARVLVDGRLVGQVASGLDTFFNYSLILGHRAKSFSREGPWPTIIETSLRTYRNFSCHNLISLLARIGYNGQGVRL
jgi:hypothetical protein